MALTVIGRTSWAGKRDADMHRNYTVRTFVRSDTKLDGPQVVMDHPGLFQPGELYNPASANDTDDWAFCYPDADIRMVDERQDNTLTWQVDQKFSTRPLGTCAIIPITDPLLEPMTVGGSFVRYLKAATTDLYGRAILSSSWELLRGRELEFDESYPTVWVEQHVANLELELFSSYVNCVNDALLWGMNPRCVKLSNAPWSRRTFGACEYFYIRRFEFDINFNTFDRYVMDEGTKALNGHLGTTGSGCTILITSVTGEATNNGVYTVALGSGGTGYQASQTFTLALQQVGNEEGGASVTVQSDGSGVVTSIIVISDQGQGYTTDLSGVPTIGSGWILDNINGATPNYLNPQHFIRYKDKNGENARVILDGRGQPAIGKYPGQRFVQKYPAVNFLALGIPTTL